MMRGRAAASASARVWIRSSSTTAHTTSNANSGGNGSGLPAIQRHGEGDGLVSLNVGGTKFQTLRSTIAQNAVLMDHVVRAEKNAEISGTGGSDGPAIFVDRDPKHFGVILSYLRNKADGVYRPSFGRTNNGGAGGKTAQSATEMAHSKLSASSFIQLPKDSKSLTEMYFETIHYNIPELTNRICSQQGLTRIFDLFGSNNPFQMAAQVVAAGKRALVLLGTMATASGGWVYAQAVAAQAKTNELIANNGACEECGEEGAAKNSVEYWTKQAQFWKAAADKFRANARGTG
ncbi:hypothetical protein ACHAXT_011468 [Thalassiosira profunda]